ncbi:MULTISPECIES: carbon-nitrogen hydrolase family protein [Caproicibacterium]|jgi:predicted amidohydrolase|uniref:Carbon-nitrogen hydrolase family protein n=1 Tax=Caproicibacterium lactatifermentans TaxID=2666138 RepID=A0A859DU95_9FIRM|nr:carbon-nitrogen hydrolase family protein [Caproicibacterium lactatifermentans]ARP50677.1 carbon-nitrogen hydrolase [Ruminococcaceae bacterium CPB6]MDD4808120.1 carbon-nitrogen hydrolase family protein [Oscillospiraceae bacterium]QKN23591.1 carbon-nitrogen hydrolase family protein [Caproicibacterium lactatifermentans]QKO29733.1 carbon-nitrogen hydrolase family protein [Caproicibacterium lactatifermentans]
MKLALIQMIVQQDKQKNLNHAAAMVEQAAQSGAQMAVLPEMFVCPYENKSFVRAAEKKGDLIWQTLSRMASQNHLWLVGGSFPGEADGCLYNSCFIFQPDGRQAACHRKLHLFDIAVEGGQSFRESDTFSPGSEITVFDTAYGKIGVCICFDFRFPELAGLMQRQGARLLIVPAAFNMTTGPAHWELLFRQRAVDNQLFTAGAAPARDEMAPYVSYGNSILCSPWGDVLARAGSGEEMLLYEIDFAGEETVRRQLPLLSARREDLYTLRQTGQQ